MENHDFMEKAPPAVIEKNKTRLNEVNNQIKSLEEQYADMAH
jgi:valyl-tRNA synthetase